MAVENLLLRLETEESGVGVLVLLPKRIVRRPVLLTYSIKGKLETRRNGP